MNEDWQAQRARYEVFSATELGKLYRAYHKATIDYWRQDLSETISNKRLDQIAREATNAFVAKLMEITGV